MGAKAIIPSGDDAAMKEAAGAGYKPCRGLKEFESFGWVNRLA
jgi:hypothetical protein